MFDLKLSVLSDIQVLSPVGEWASVLIFDGGLFGD